MNFLKNKVKIQKVKKSTIKAQNHLNFFLVLVLLTGVSYPLKNGLRNNKTSGGDTGRPELVRQTQATDRPMGWCRPNDSIDSLRHLIRPRRRPV